MSVDFRLFSRIVRRNGEIYFFKIVTLSVAFSCAMAVLAFCLNEFLTDHFKSDVSSIYRLLQKKPAGQYSGNRLSNQIPSTVVREIQNELKSVTVARIKVLEEVNVVAGRDTFFNQTFHAVDRKISEIFDLQFREGSQQLFEQPDHVLISEKKARQFFGTSKAIGKKISILAVNDTLHFSIAAVFEDFPGNTHEAFDIFLPFDSVLLSRFHYNTVNFGALIRLQGKDNVETIADHLKRIQGKDSLKYILQPWSDI